MRVSKIAILIACILGAPAADADSYRYNPTYWSDRTIDPTSDPEREFAEEALYLGCAGEEAEPRPFEPNYDEDPPRGVRAIWQRPGIRGVLRYCRCVGGYMADLLFDSEIEHVMADRSVTPDMLERQERAETICGVFDAR